jgi:site-specific DNA-cytosine methylase
MLNASSFGNSQLRKRYFFVAYRDDRVFNVVLPELPESQPLVYDFLYPQRDRETREFNYGRDKDYDEDCYKKYSETDKAGMLTLPAGWSLQGCAVKQPGLLSDHHRQKWDDRTSNLPFSLHCISRLAYLKVCPTLTGSCGRHVHPELDRGITVGEAAYLMGWPKHPDGSQVIPRGDKPYAEIAKGVVPAVGKWLGEQARLYVDKAWGADEDYEVSYDATTGEFVGHDATGQLEKTIDLTNYYARNIEPRPLTQEPRGYENVQQLRRDVERDAPVGAHAAGTT